MTRGAGVGAGTRSRRGGPESWEHRFVEANGLRFHVVIQEPPGGAGAPLVMLLHGFPEFWYSWRHQIPALAAAGFRVAAPDLRGYNESDKPEGIEAYRMTNLVDDVAGIIGALGHERAAIVGHDWGGAVGFGFALLRPGMTARLCVLNAPHPAAFVRELRRGNLAQLRRSWYMFFFQLPDAPEALLSADGFRVLRAMMARTAPKGIFPRAVLARYVEAFAKPGALTAAINWYRASFRHGLPPTEGFPAIAAPTLLLWGDKDPFLGRELTRGIRVHFSGSLTLRHLPGVGHWVQQEAPRRVNDLLMKFLLKA